MVGSPAPGPQVFGPSSSRTSIDEDRPVWEPPSCRRKPKWLRETLKEAKEFGSPKEPVRTIVIPDRLGMALVASLRDSKPSTLERCHDGRVPFHQHHVWRDAMMEEYHSTTKTSNTFTCSSRSVTSR